MKPCPDFKEKLMMDAYGELQQEDRFVLESHLKSCEGCRRERDRLARLLERIKETVPSPEIPPALSREMTGSIIKNIKATQEKTWWRKLRWTGGYRTIPALAAACLIVFVIGWFSIKTLNQSSPSRTMFTQGSEHQPVVQDIEVIENLDFLEDMDILNKLVERVDERDFL
jgi:predicted anti-sigma-YlaC factor YlaD